MHFQIVLTVLYMMFMLFTLLVNYMNIQKQVFGDLEATYFLIGGDIEYHDEEKEKTRKVLSWGTATIFSIASIVVISIFIFSPNIGAIVSGTCPNSSSVYFHENPIEADLECCNWHNKGSCINSRMKNKHGMDFCYLKPNYNAGVDYQSTYCNDLLGLASCSMFRNDSGNFFDWDEDKSHVTNIRICKSFCEELYEACGSASDGEETWGVLYSDGSELCRIRFPFSVVEDNQNCFNSGSLVEISLLLIVLSILLQL
eukprot:TRINITY_DN3886_c0_g1_i1.p1 TRINITY_DN3886_c0_g1~~TRINITY_DN3886_c0_g1_i1.p1  ORF type:complete len:256 (-),score=40.64 TRINITY_DN3886_c0_g1_i1:51-818(-)